MISKKFFKVFGNEERVKLLHCLKKKKSVGDLLFSCNLSQSALSQHLKVLKDGNVVTSERDGKFIYYKIKDKRILTIVNLLLKK